jgi:hypothetical protein
LSTITRIIYEKIFKIVASDFYVNFGFQEFSGKAMERAKEVDSKCRADVGGAEKGKFK